MEHTRPPEASVPSLPEGQELPPSHPFAQTTPSCTKWRRNRASFVFVTISQLTLNPSVLALCEPTWLISPSCIHECDLDVSSEGFVVVLFLKNLFPVVFRPRQRQMCFSVVYITVKQTSPLQMWQTAVQVESHWDCCNCTSHPEITTGEQPFTAVLWASLTTLRRHSSASQMCLGFFKLEKQSEQWPSTVTVILTKTKKLWGLMSISFHSREYLWSLYMKCTKILFIRFWGNFSILFQCQIAKELSGGTEVKPVEIYKQATAVQSGHVPEHPSLITIMWQSANVGLVQMTTPHSFVFLWTTLVRTVCAAHQGLHLRGRRIMTMAPKRCHVTTVGRCIH